MPSEDEQKKAMVSPDADSDSTMSAFNEQVQHKDIDQVRDILFGDRSREYDHRLRILDRHVESLQSNVQRLIEHGERLAREKNDLQERVRDQQLKHQLKLEEIQRIFSDELRQQQRDFDTKLDGLLSTVHHLIDELDGRKLDQAHMAEMIFDLGMRIKRTIKKPVSPEHHMPQLTDEYTK